MLRLAGILIVCLSTLINPAVHAAAMAPDLLQQGGSAHYVHTLDCDGAPSAFTMAVPQHCMNTVHETAEAQRCHVGVTPLIEGAGSATSSSIDLSVCLGSARLRGITIAPPHGPPKVVPAVQFA